MRATPNWDMYFTLDAEITRYLARQQRLQRTVRLPDPFQDFPARKFWLAKLISAENQPA